MLYLGTGSANTEISEWRAAFWFKDIADGYTQSGKQLQAYWLQQVPNTSDPDPVYRFIREPSDRLRNEAQVFLQQVHDKVQKQTGAAGGQTATESSSAYTATNPSADQIAEPADDQEERWYHNADETPPSGFKYGFLAGYKREFAEVCFETRADHRSFADACIGNTSCFWVRKLTRLENKYPFGIWFKAEDDFQAAERRLTKLRESKTESNTPEG